MHVDIDRQRLGHADRIGELDGAAPGEAGGNHVLGEIAGGIGGGAVDLGRILAGEGAAAMRGGAAIGVDDDLAAGQPTVAIGAANVEFSRRIDVPDRLLGDPVLRQGRANIRLDYVEDGLGSQVLMEVLVRDDDLRDACRPAVPVLDGHLALGVGAELHRLARPARRASLRVLRMWWA